MVFSATDKMHKMVTMKNPADFKELAHLYHKKASSAATVHLCMILSMYKSILYIQISDKQEKKSLQRESYCPLADGVLLIRTLRY